MSSPGRNDLRYVMGLLYAVAGVLHFLVPRAYERIVLPQFPRPRLLVYCSGVAEVVLGVGVLFERTRRLSAWGLVALLVAVFPANVYMAVSNEFELPEPLEDVSDLALWARLPLQAALVAWALWYTDPPESSLLPEDLGERLDE